MTKNTINDITELINNLIAFETCLNFVSAILPVT